MLDFLAHNSSSFVIIILTLSAMLIVALVQMSRVLSLSERLAEDIRELENEDALLRAKLRHKNDELLDLISLKGILVQVEGELGAAVLERNRMAALVGPLLERIDVLEAGGERKAQPEGEDMNLELKPEILESIAKACHEIVRNYNGGLEAHALEPWEYARGDAKESSRLAVEHLFGTKNFDPGALHEKWVEDRIAAGWTYGETKDWDKKTHPQLVPFDELPLSQRVKDDLISATVKGLLAHHGLMGQDT